MPVNFEENSWPELEEYIKKDALILVPVGAIEQHGPHLPVATDMIIARNITASVAEGLKDEIPVLVIPDMWQAYNGNILKKGWPGSLTIGQDIQKKLLIGITESIIDMGFKKMIYINTHGQNLFTLESVVRTIADKYGIYLPFVFEYKIAADFMDKNRRSGPGGICHACELETSLMLYLTDLVNMEKAVNNTLKYRSKFRNTDGMASSRVFWSTWGLEETETGVLGDPAKASRELGEKAFKYIVEEISGFAREYYRHKKGQQ